MADSPSTPPPSDGKGQKKGGLLTLIKKNKTAAIVVGVIGGYYFYKKSKENAEGGSPAQSEQAVEAQVAGYQANQAYNEALASGNHEEAERLRRRIEEEEEERIARRKAEETEEVTEKPNEPAETPEPNNPGSTSPSPEPNEPGPTGSQGVSIHGRTFSGATSSRIVKSGKTTGGKEYVEYAITFPGKVEHWQYFTATGNWRQVSASNSGGGAGKPGPGNNPPPKHNPVGGPVTGPKSKPRPPRPAPVGVGPAKPAPGPAPPPSNPSHPLAVNTGNRCVNGGVGGHTAPPGYHLFCQDGWIWRAPNS